MSVIIYHNPRCSKSRQALQLLSDAGIKPEIIEYLNSPPTMKELKTILALLKLEPRGLMRTREQVYSDLNLEDTSLSDDDLLKAMVENPVLIERPVVVANDRAVIGRPPESVLQII